MNVKRLVRRAFQAVAGGLTLAYSKVVGAPSAENAAGEPERILVLRQGLLGDAILMTPALRMLRQRFPLAKIDVLVMPAQQAVIESLPVVDGVTVWTAGDLLEPRMAFDLRRWWRAAACVALLRRRQYDLAVVSYGRVFSAVALLAGIPRRIGYAGETLAGTLTLALPGQRYDRAWHEAEYNAGLVVAGNSAAISTIGDGAGTGGVISPSGNPPAGLPPLELGPSLANAQQAPWEVRIGATQWRKPIIVLHPGATNGEAKRWPLPYWTELAATLVQGGVTVVLVGHGSDDENLSRVIEGGVGGPHPLAPTPDSLTPSAPASLVFGCASPRRRAEASSDDPTCSARSQATSGELRSAPGHLVNLVGKTTVGQLAWVVQRAAVVVTGDSGPMHVAVALRRPVVAIFGPTDSAIYGPFQTPLAEVVRHRLPCQPCYRLDRMATCPLGHTLCQWLIEPAAVLAAVRRLLAHAAVA